LRVQKVGVLFALLLEQLTHLKEDRVIFFIQSSLVQTEMLVVKDQALVLLLNFVRKLLAESFDLFVKVDNVFLGRKFFLSLFRYVRHIQWGCGLLELLDQVSDW
jgi:hypothetical protein